MASSLERIDPDTLIEGETTGRETLQLHLDRYRFAGQNLIIGNCIDIACGIGYGSYLLATDFSSVIDKIIAVDVDEKSIDEARKRYAHPLIKFEVGDALGFDIPFLVQNVVSLETIEHLPDPAAFIAHMSKRLVKGGRFIASVPITPSMDANPYHLHDFTRSSFIELFRRNGFKPLVEKLQIQPYKIIDVMGKKEERSKDIRRGLLLYYLKHPGKFFLRIKSLFIDGLQNKYLVAVFEKL